MDETTRGPAPLWDPEVAEVLNNALGPTLTSALAGSSNPRISLIWAKHLPDGFTPSREQIRRLRFASEQWLFVADLEGEDVARMWFIGANPVLGMSPVEAISKDRFHAVSAVAHVMVEDGFL